MAWMRALDRQGCAGIGFYRDVWGGESSWVRTSDLLIKSLKFNLLM
jgi:hypothetical protein